LSYSTCSLFHSFGENSFDKPIIALQKDYTTTLSRLLNGYSSVGQEAIDQIFTGGSVEVVRKDEIVFHENRFNAFEYFQLEGVSHRYNTDSEKHVLTTGIYQNETVIPPNFARTTNGLSIFTLEALTDCTYFKIPVDRFGELLDKNQQIKMLGHVVIEKEFAKSLKF
jgi:hypothetical protein